MAKPQASGNSYGPHTPQAQTSGTLSNELLWLTPQSSSTLSDKCIWSTLQASGQWHARMCTAKLMVNTAGELSFALFDVGQFERIGPADTKAILWALSWLSSPERHLLLRSVALDHLSATSCLRDRQMNRDAAAIKDLQDKIQEAFNLAVAPFEDGTIPDKKQAFFRFLRNSEQLGVMLPKGAFAVAKMIDGILSQELSFNLPSVVDDSIEDFLRRGMTWGETFSIGKSVASRYLKGTNGNQTDK